MMIFYRYAIERVYTFEHYGYTNLRLRTSTTDDCSKDTLKDLGKNGILTIILRRIGCEVLIVYWYKISYNGFLTIT